MTKYPNAELFRQEAKERFDFLERLGFVSTEADECRALFSSGDFAIEVLYDEREGAVVTMIDSFVGAANLRAELSCVYAEADLGPPQDVRQTARSRHSLSKALQSQAAAPGRLLSILQSPKRDALMKKCHGS